MSVTLGIDYAWQHPDPAQIKTAGYSFVVRYLSQDPSKDLTAPERDALWAQELGILLVWETTSGRALAGTQAGIDDAREAVTAARALGYPDDVPLLFADDTDTTADQVRPYFKGVATIRPCSGGYGGIKVVDPLLADGTIRFGWQACAWSGQQVSQTAHLYQRLRPTLNLAGFFDEDVLLRPLPMWTAAAVQPAQPPPAPITAPIITTGRRTPVPVIFRVTDGPAVNTEIFDYGYGPVHISVPEAQELAAAKVPIVNISGATYANRFKDVK